MEKEKNLKKLNNGGFSLVELIIVIAIMAILIGVLAPQYMKYVERSRKSTDVQNVASIISALQIYAADPNVTTADRLATGTVTLTTTQEDVSTTNATNHASNALTAAGINKIGLKSGNWGAKGAALASVNLEITVTNGVVSVACDDAPGLITGVYAD